MEAFANFFADLVILFLVSAVIWTALETLVEYKTSFWKVIGCVIILGLLTDVLTYRAFKVVEGEMKKEKIVEKSP